MPIAKRKPETFAQMSKRERFYSPRILARARSIPNGFALLDMGLLPEVHDDMLRRVAAGEKPVTALSQPMVKAFGEAARNDSLRRLAGEVAALIVETKYGCERRPGSREIAGDPVFSSGTPFRLPPDVPSGVAAALPSKVHDDGATSDILLRLLSDEVLNGLAQQVEAERQRRSRIGQMNRSEELTS